MSDYLPGYDEWKTAYPEMTEQQEREMEEKCAAQQQEFCDAVAAVFADERQDIYLATIREIVIEELNKLRPGPGEPEWQTKTPVPIPRMG